jgi:hypothetical protein
VTGENVMSIIGQVDNLAKQNAQVLMMGDRLRIIYKTGTDVAALRAGIYRICPEGSHVFLDVPPPKKTWGTPAPVVQPQTEDTAMIVVDTIARTDDATNLKSLKLSRRKPANRRKYTLFNNGMVGS